MSTFAVRVHRLTIETHPNADALELARVGDYRAVVGKGQFQTGDLAAYIPEAGLLPDALIEALGLTGKLAGSAHNRVKAIKLRGVLSQGLCVVARPDWVEGQDVTAELGVEKYEPPIPEGMAGEVYVLEPHEVVHFDLENIKAYPDVFAEGEAVVFTEKLHGTFMMALGLPARLARATDGHAPGGRFAVSSKGLMHKRLGLKHNEANAFNLYLRTAARFNLAEAVPALAERLNAPVAVLGEVVGHGVQDLAYGQKVNQALFRVFAIVVDGVRANDAELDAYVAELGLERVPVVYRGPFSAAVLEAHTNGIEALSGQGVHLREGVVVTPLIEREDPRIGRAALKSVSEAYLLRKGATEYT